MKYNSRCEERRLEVITEEAGVERGSREMSDGISDGVTTY